MSNDNTAPEIVRINQHPTPDDAEGHKHNAPDFQTPPHDAPNAKIDSRAADDAEGHKRA